METYRAIGKFINKSFEKKSVFDPLVLYSALFEEEGGINAWLNVNKKQYDSIKLGKRVIIEYDLSELPNGKLSATLLGKENA